MKKAKSPVGAENTVKVWNLLSSVNNRSISRLLGSAHSTETSSRQPQQPIHGFFCFLSFNVTFETQALKGTFDSQEFSWQMLAVTY